MHLLIKYILVSLLLMVSTSTSARPADNSCAPSQQIQSSFSTGGSWALCWQESIAEGIVLSNIYFTTASSIQRRVLGEASLSQIQTDYDDGQTLMSLSASEGLGGNHLKTLSDNDCPGGQLHSLNGRKVLCEIKRSRGYIYKHSTGGQRQGEMLELFSVSEVDNRTYAIRWQFYDNGIILPAVGLTGALPRAGTNSVNGWEIGANNQVMLGFTDHYFWRLDFDLGNDSGNEIVEEIVSVPSADRRKKFKDIIEIQTESIGSLDYEKKRFWRIRDSSISDGGSGFISYEMVLLNFAHQSAGNANLPWLSGDVFFTVYNSCERLAVNNDSSACADSVDQFVDSQDLHIKDIVAWYRQSYHHLPRDEDNSRIAIRWNSFELLPRDWTAQNPLDL